ncbi:phosphoesterase [Helicobacter enhydrae]|uniref:Phosphoesterase n=1 Tax=Helicobacter enhydrae TaxID=222136 RepID=A0A1B1U568_9HELI|nr:phosphoesterase [Helicobacter enhydrae]ANV97898.1 phosphoesterase [Helicobacter enhydrae]
MQVYHLSHIDLDGYGAQYIAKHFFGNITFFNANYGKEIQVRLNEIFDLIKAQKPSKALLLITDLNLTPEESILLQDEIAQLKIQGIDITLKLLDHHISGEESAKKFHWYFLDTSRSATQITFDTLSTSYPLLDSSTAEYLANLTSMINCVDLWKKEAKQFELGKVMMGIIAQLKDPTRTMFDTQNRAIKFFFLDALQDIINLPNAEVTLDNQFYQLKKQAFGGDPLTQTMDNILADYLVTLLEANKDSYLITYQDKKGLLTYGLGSTSVIGNQFLCQNSDFDFFIDINMRGNLSLRANNRCDVSQIAAQCFNGGGHKNASGGKLDSFKESFFYEDIRNQIQETLKERE